MSNDRDGIDQATSFWLDKGGGAGDPTTQAWSDERERVAADPDVDDWKGRDNEDRERDTVAAWDEVKSRDNDRSDWESGRPHRDWIAERWPGTKLGNYVADKLGWHAYFQRDPVGAQEQWTRHWLKMPPVQNQPKPAPKDEPHPDLDERGRIEWQRDKDVRDGVRTASREGEDENDFTTTADLRALVKERTGLTLSQFLEQARIIDEASLADPAQVARRFAAYSGAPTSQQHAAEMVREQKVEGAQTWLNQLQQSGRLAQLVPDYHEPGHEQEIGNVLIDMEREGLRTGNWENDLYIAGNAARLIMNERQQMTGAVDSQEQQHILTAYNSLVEKGFGTDSAMQYARELVRAAYQEQRDAANANRARFASRSVSGAPSGTPGPATKRDFQESYDDDLLRDVSAAVRNG